MTQKNNNLWNVAMDSCAVCWKEYQILMQTRAWSDIFKWQMKVCTWGLCDECKKKIDDNVQLFCDTCKWFMLIKIESDMAKEFEFKPWDKYKIHKCVNCTKNDSIEFLPPNFKP